MPEVPSRLDASALRWLVGHDLREARERVGHTQSTAARVLDCTHAKINYLELGKTAQRPEDVRALLRSYGSDPTDVERLAALALRADRDTWWHEWSDVVPTWLRTFVGLEGLAASEFAYEPLLLHGLLQTRAYATALLVDSLRVGPADGDRVVDLRLARQQRLTDEQDPLRLHAVIEECALRRPVGGDAVMIEQLDHLLALAGRSTVTLQVMPLSVAVHDGLDGEFALLDFLGTRSIAYIEIPNGAVYLQDHDQVEGYRSAATRLSDSALTESDSTDWLRRLRRELHAKGAPTNPGT